jgi:hypothetical protein
VNAASKTFSYDLFVGTRGNLTGPFYLTFGRTDPATLAYQERDEDQQGDE